YFVQLRIAKVNTKTPTTFFSTCKTLYGPWDTVTSFEESGLMLRIAGRRASPSASLERGELHARGDLPRQAARRHRGPQGASASTTSSSLRSGPLVHVAAVDVSSGAILRRVGLSQASASRIAKDARGRKPHLIDWKDVDIEQTDEAAVRLAVPQHQARAASTLRTSPTSCTSSARGARRRLRRPRGRARRGHVRGAAPVVPGVAAASTCPTRRPARSSARCRRTTPPTCSPTCPTTAASTSSR
ncbi:MAG: hypothetical protein MZV63_34330, partial [Marinilabiliales bacterium]|nr:hypothetical protein [Marinilabiliales bacterium]